MVEPTQNQVRVLCPRSVMVSHLNTHPAAPPPNRSSTVGTALKIAAEALLAGNNSPLCLTGTGGEELHRWPEHHVSMILAS